MEFPTKTITLVVATLLIVTSRGSSAIHSEALSINAIRADDQTDELQLNISWSTAPADGGYNLYDVKVWHVATDGCMIEPTLFVNHHNLTCAPIHTETENTSVLMPRDPFVHKKHECVIMAHCTYNVVVQHMDNVFYSNQIFKVPECVNRVCSCYYKHLLPNITSTMVITGSRVVVSWSLQYGNTSETDLPAGVMLDHVAITARQFRDKARPWDGHERTKKMSANETGSWTFEVEGASDIEDSITSQVKLFDSRRCFTESESLIGSIVNEENSTDVPGDCLGVESAECQCQDLKRTSNFSVMTHVEDLKMVVNWNVVQSPKAVPVEPKLVKLSLDDHEQRNILTKTAQWNEHPIQLNFAQTGVVGPMVILRTTMVDAEGCEINALPLTVVMPHSTSFEIHYTFVVVVALGVMAVTVFCVFFTKRKRNPRRITKNWRTGHETPNSHQHLGQMQMEENRLYTDMEIIEARAKGEADLLEVPQSCLRIGREIGKGAFGRVFIASASKLPNCDGPKVVAVKQLKKCPKRMPEFEEFLDEITMMKQVGRHPNIVTLLGCCTLKEPLTMIMEYIGCGDLLEYLRKIRAKHLARVARLEAETNMVETETVSLPRANSDNSGSTVFKSMLKYMDVLHTSSSNSDKSYISQPDTVLRPSVTETMYTTLSSSKEHDDLVKSQASIEYVLDHKELHNFARQIACGMKHLEFKNITHRDLAARNILIDERKTLKISDFGLSRSGIYVNTRNKKVPLRWLSLEAMRDNLYSSKSDVWAFGIVLWEIGTLGGYPYPTVSNHELLTYLNNGNRLEQPENCSVEVYELMLNCWKTEPDDRPSFADIFKSLEPHRRIYIDFNEIEPTYVFPPTSVQIKQTVTNNK